MELITGSIPTSRSLFDFWTYTCINCLRTLPHLTSWYDKYNSQGFVIIGVHTPEFQFEHEAANVQQAIRSLLKEAGRTVEKSLDDLPDSTPRNRISPETYLGSARMQYYFSTGSLGNGTQKFSLSPNPSLNSYSLGGEWTINRLTPIACTI